jgi:serine O-acetyltransferase
MLNSVIEASNTVVPSVADPPSGTTEVSALQPDWTRERPERWWDPSRRLLGALRDYSRARRRGGVTGHAMRKLAAARHRFWAVVTGADIPLNTQHLGGGLLLPHPQGVVVHPEAKVGPNCLLLQQVTIGTGPKPGLPVLGGHVDVGAGARILGGVVIGDHATIGANAVVIDDVPPGAVAVGVPAVVKRVRPIASRGSRADVGAQPRELPSRVVP